MRGCTQGIWWDESSKCGLGYWARLASKGSSEAEAARGQLKDVEATIVERRKKIAELDAKVDQLQGRYTDLQDTLAKLQRRFSQAEAV